MGAKQILNKLEKVDMVLDFGGEKVVVGLKKSEIKKGKTFKKVMEEMKKAA